MLFDGLVSSRKRLMSLSCLDCVAPLMRHRHGITSSEDRRYSRGSQRLRSSRPEYYDCVEADLKIECRRRTAGRHAENSRPLGGKQARSRGFYTKKESQSEDSDARSLGHLREEREKIL